MEIGRYHRLQQSQAYWIQVLYRTTWITPILPRVMDKYIVRSFFYHLLPPPFHRPVFIRSAGSTTASLRVLSPTPIQFCSRGLHGDGNRVNPAEPAGIPWGWKQIFAGTGWDGMEVLWGWKWNWTGTAGDGCNFCPHAGLYSVLFVLCCRLTSLYTLLPSTFRKRSMRHGTQPSWTRWLSCVARPTVQLD